MATNENLIYSVDNQEKTLELWIAKKKVGNLLKMPDFSVSVSYDDQVIGKIMNGVIKNINEMADAVGSMVPETDMDLGSTLNKGIDGIQETMKAFLDMQGVSPMTAGIFTRKYFDHVAHQKYAFSVRASHADLNRLLEMKSTFMPSPMLKGTVEKLLSSIGNIARPSAWWGNEEEGTDYGMQYLEGLKDGVYDSVNEGVKVYNRDKGVNLKSFSDKLDKISQKQNDGIEKRIDNLMGIDQELKDTANKELGLLKGMQNIDIIQARAKIGVKEASMALDNAEQKTFKLISEIIDSIANATSVLAPEQFMVEDIQIMYAGDDITKHIIQVPSSQNQGVIYRNQHLIVDNISINPSESMMTSKENIMVPLYYDIEITMSTTMTPVATNYVVTPITKPVIPKKHKVKPEPKKPQEFKSKAFVPKSNINIPKDFAIKPATDFTITPSPALSQPLYFKPKK